MANPVAKQMKDSISSELGIPKSAVSVRYDGSYNIRIIDPRYAHLLKKAEALCMFARSVRYDEYSGEILQGGNTFVFASVDWDAERSIDREWVQNIQAAGADFDAGEIVNSGPFQIQKRGNNFSIYYTGGGGYFRPNYYATTIDQVANAIVGFICGCGENDPTFSTAFPEQAAYVINKKPQTNMQQDFMGWLGESVIRMTKGASAKEMVDELLEGESLFGRTLYWDQNPNPDATWSDWVAETGGLRVGIDGTMFSIGPFKTQGNLFVIDGNLGALQLEDGSLAWVHPGQVWLV